MNAAPRFLVVALAIVGSLTAAALYWSFPAVLGLLAGVNVATMALYGYDKAVAGGSWTRVPERVLHLLALLGGSPAALLSRTLFRHKTLKPGFGRMFWLIVVLQLAIIAAVVGLYLRPPDWLPSFLRFS